MNILKNLWGWWKGIAQKIGNFQARLILSLFYFIIVSPFALAMRIFSDPLKLRQNLKDSYWFPKEASEDALEKARRQY